MELGYPAVLKTRQGGYDGKGQCIIKSSEDVEAAWQQLDHVPLILEQFINYEKEVSLVSVRDKSGNIRHYPLTHNVHQQGVLAFSQAPFDNLGLQLQAQTYMERLLVALSYVGVLTIEFFVKDHHLIANEIAPRVHNSGHWTIEGTEVSQFENHVRAVMGLPLGGTQALGFSALFNCIGKEPLLADILQVPGAHSHHYGKPARTGRKLGHVTLHSLDQQSLQLGIEQVRKIMRA